MKSEDAIRRKYELLGYTVIHRGAPDFLIFKTDFDLNMTDIEFIEVKRRIEPLSFEQQIWRCALQTMNCKFKVETPTGIIQNYDSSRLIKQIEYLKKYEEKTIIS